MEGRPVNSSANSPHNSRLATKRNSSAAITATEAVKGILHIQETTCRFSYITAFYLRIDPNIFISELYSRAYWWWFSP